MSVVRSDTNRHGRWQIYNMENVVVAQRQKVWVGLHKTFEELYIPNQTAFFFFFGLFIIVFMMTKVQYAWGHRGAIWRDAMGHIRG